MIQLMEAMDSMLEKAGVDKLIRVTGPSQVDNLLVPEKLSCFQKKTILFSPEFIPAVLKVPASSQFLPKPAVCRSCHNQGFPWLSYCSSSSDPQRTVSLLL